MNTKENTVRYIALSFDVEEFDLPLERGLRSEDFGLDSQISVSSEGLERILDLLERQDVVATFFCTARYALSCPDMVRRIVDGGHELASHNYHHSSFDDGDLLRSREVLESISGRSIYGFRSPRMGSVSADDLKSAGYEWDSSLNPCFLPGRYNNSKSPRLPFREQCGLIELPASVSNVFRLPLFWLSIHNFPLWFYKLIAKGSLRKSGFLNIYTHPWEYSDRLHDNFLRIPYIIRRNSGLKMVRRYESLICSLKRTGGKFVTLSGFASAYFK